VIVLRDYQRAAVDAIRGQWRSGVRSTLLVLPTGTGKTQCFTEVLCEELAVGGGRALVLAHREELLTQAKDTLVRRGLSVDLERAEEAAATHGGLFGEALVSDVVVASVQTLREKRRKRWARDAFTHVVIDEAHHAAARTYGDILEHFGHAKVLGVTATPDRGDGKGLGDAFESIAFSYDIRDAIRERHLSPIRVKAIDVASLDISQVKSVRGDLDAGALSKELREDETLHEIAGPLAREAGDRSTLVFCVDVAQSEALAQVLTPYVGVGRVAVVHGAMERETRKGILAAYATGEIQFLVNCMVLTEGFDAPRTACVAMARPTKSRALYAQCLGRGTRLYPGKEDCLVLDFRGNAGRHKLTTPLDVLHSNVDDAVRERAEELAQQGMTLDAALSQAERDVEADRERERERQAKLAAARAKRHLTADVAYHARSIDPFGEGPELDAAKPASDRQLAVLVKAGLQVPPETSQAWASKQIDKIITWQRRGLANYKQRKVLARNGLETNLYFQDASAAIDALAANGWRPSAEIRAKWGPKGGVDAAE
jgi:superfamily II DNA or RNA helicase